MEDVTVIEAEVKSEIEQFRGSTDIVINDKESYEYAGEIILRGKSILKGIADKFAAPVKAAYDAHKQIKGLQNNLEEPIKKMIADLQSKANAYLTEQERLRREEQKRLDDERRAKEEAERERLRAEAEKAEKEGKTEQAAALKVELETVVVVPEIAQAEVEKTTRLDEGVISAKADIDVTITDKAAFLRKVIEEQRWDFIEIKEAAFKRFAKAAGLTEYPGTVIAEVKKAAFRAR
ncbi:MAG TPA: hypothetical protein PKL77_07330 [Candidatus Omnitrophota bacterium]|nr:hypothetical protein [Candidatus Omnitrophota bacterium]